MNARLLDSKRLRLRPFVLDDVSEICRLASNPKLSKMTAHVPYPYTIEHAQVWVQKQIHAQDLDTHHSFAIEQKREQHLIGVVSLAMQDRESAVLGYWIGEVYWNRGYCTEAVTCLFGYAAAELKLTKITASHLVENPASGRVMQKAGMTHLGSDRIVGRDHALVDMEVYQYLLNRVC